MENTDELPDLTPDEERLLNLLVEYDQALADGTATTVDTCPPPGVHPELADQLVRGKHLLELMATVAENRDDEELTPQGQFAEAVHESAVHESAASLDDFLSSIQRDKQTPARLGRFIVERELGVGGHGVVLLAFDPVLKRQVAIKIPRPEATVSSALRRRFVREARAAARLTHPNLVSVYEVGEVGRLGYIATAYSAGPSLATWLHERGQPLASRDAARLLVQLAEAVHYAHSQGVVHRDIKPSNVLLEPLADDKDTRSDAATGALPFVPKLVDFGMAKLEGLAGSDTVSGVAIGTPGYMAPEQVEGRVADIDARTDVYGLGTVLYETLTGMRPFAGESDAELMRRILDEDPISPSRARSDVEPDMAAICLKCLEKRPDRRYATAQAMADDLRRYLAGEPIVARPVTPAERLARWAGRNPGVAMLSSAVLLLLTALALASTIAAVRINRALDLEQEARQQAQRETARAEEETARAEAERVRAEDFAREARSESETAHSVATYLEGMFRSADPVGLEGFRFRPQVDGSSELTAADILRQGAERLEADLAEQPAVQAKLMSVIGSVYVTLGMLREAEPLLERSLQIRKVVYGESSTQAAESLHNLATLRFATFDFSDTKRLLNQALAIRVKQLGPDHPDTIRTKFNLAWLVVTNGHETRAEKARVAPFMEEVVRFHRREGDSPVRYAFALIGLGMLRYEVDQQPLQAGVLMADANRVLSKNGDSDIGAGFMMMLRSYVQRRVGNGRGAVASAEAAIERLKKAVGETHPVLVWPHYLWAEALISNGQEREALDVYRETLALCNRLYDEQHRTVGMTLARMAEPFVLLNQVADAERVLRQALQIFRRDDGNLANRASCVQRLSLVLAEQGRHDEAAALCRQEVVAARALGPDPETLCFLASMLWELAQAEIAYGNWAQAEEALSEATKVDPVPAWENAAGLPGMLTALARVQLAQGRVDEYQATCRKLMNNVPKNVSRPDLRDIVWTCSLYPGAVDDPGRLLGMAERAVARGGAQGDARPVLAAALFRAGRHQPALVRLGGLARANANPQQWTLSAWLAIAQAKAGLTDQAAATIDQLAQWPSGQQDDLEGVRDAPLDQSERDTLLDEARNLLSAHTPPQQQPPPDVR